MLLAGPGNGVWGPGVSRGEETVSREQETRIPGDAVKLRPEVPRVRGRLEVPRVRGRSEVVNGVSREQETVLRE